MRMALEAMKLLHLCDYAHQEVCCVLAHTSVPAPPRSPGGRAKKRLGAGLRTLWRLQSHCT